jgi:hypothetical protein
MSIYLLPKSIVNGLDKIRRSFFGKGEEQRKNIISSGGLKSVRARKKEV